MSQEYCPAAPYQGSLHTRSSEMLSRQEAEPRAHGRLEGVEPVAAEHPKVTFGSDAAGEVGVGCDNWKISRLNLQSGGAGLVVRPFCLASRE